MKSIGILFMSSAMWAVGAALADGSTDEPVPKEPVLSTTNPVPPVRGVPVIPVESVDGVSLPVVPVSAAKTPPLEPPKVRTIESPADIGGADTGPMRIHVEPGVTDLVPIARNYMNHIVTPFDDPKVITVNPIEFKKEGSSIYVATTSERPVGLEIRSNDPDDTRTVSLALVPKAIPPKTITLQFKNDQGAGARASSPARANRWETAAPYEDRLMELAAKTARGEIPEGYSIVYSVDALPCELPSVEFYTGQRLIGNRFSVYVLRATNAGEETMELMGDAGCRFPGVAFVAPYPVAHIAPGESTELYVVVSNDSFEPKAQSNFRPSLLQR